MGEFYLNDYQISLMNLAGPDRLTGRIGFFGFDEGCPARDVKAWNSDPNYKEESATAKGTKEKTP
jgi:hypothetical protein